MMKSLSDQVRKPVEFAVDQIKIGDRHRKDLGDIGTLAGSIKDLGLLQPIGITAAGELIFGRRRLEAYRQLGRKKIPARILDLDDTDRLLAEHDENTERKDFTPTEAVAIGRAIEQRLRPVAEQRMKSGTGADGKAGGRGRKNDAKPCAKLAQGLGDVGKTADKAARAAGMSRATYEKAKAVIEASEADPQSYGDLAQQMDETNNVDRAYREMKSRKEMKRSRDLPTGGEHNLPKRQSPAYDRLSEEVKIFLANSELADDCEQVEELASLNPFVQGAIAQMLSTREASSVSAAKVLILDELFLSPAKALQRSLQWIVGTDLPEVRKLCDDLELMIHKVCSNSGGQEGTNRAASSPAEVEAVAVATPPSEPAKAKVTLTYSVCVQREQRPELCCWDLESREVAVAWLRENHTTPACLGMNEFRLIRSDNNDAAAVHVTVKDGEWAFTLGNGEAVSM